MFGNLFKKKYPSKFLEPNPMTTIFTLPDKFINHQVMSPVFNNKEQQGLYKLFRENGRKISSVTHLKRDTYKGEEFLCFAEFIRYGEVFWSDVDDLTSTIYGKGPGDNVKNPLGMIKVREFEFFTDTQNIPVENSKEDQEISQLNLNKYKGAYKDRVKKTEYYKDGGRYEGDWKDNKFHGQGIYTYSNGSRYEGEWKDGKQNGHGTHIYPDGSRYIGEWIDHKQNGYGINIYKDGSKYVGEWKNHKHHGQGIYTYLDGSKYEGEWKDGKQNGHGTYIYSDGSKNEGVWKDGKKI